MAAVLEGTKAYVYLSQVTWTNKINRWGYGIEMYIRISQDYLKEILETIELPNGVKLTAMLEEKLPSCYFCEERGEYQENVPPNLCRSIQQQRHMSAK